MTLSGGAVCAQLVRQASKAIVSALEAFIADPFLLCLDAGDMRPVRGGGVGLRLGVGVPVGLAPGGAFAKLRLDLRRVPLLGPLSDIFPASDDQRGSEHELPE